MVAPARKLRPRSTLAGRFVPRRAHPTPTRARRALRSLRVTLYVRCMDEGEKKDGRRENENPEKKQVEASFLPFR